MSTIDIKVLEICGGDIPTNLNQLISILSGALDSIPEEYREAAEVDCSPTYEYGEAYGSIFVTYERPLTDGERDAADDKERRRKITRIRQLEAEAALLRSSIGGGQ